jgi:hypothetical protein
MQVYRALSGRSLINGLRHGWLVLAVILSLAGCNSDSGGTAGTSGSASSSTVATSIVLSGSVGDGPVTGATVNVYASDGSLLGTMVTDATASFRSTVKARGNDYPLRLVVSGGIDLVTGLAPDFEMVSLLQSPSDKKANINPFTTFIVKLAESLPGGPTSANVEQARRTVLERLGFGLDTTLIPDPFTTQIDAGNVANLVKASEALGELVRRTRDLTGTGADRVVNALSADLTDGYLDGLGASGTDARLTAVANVAASQVAVETLNNTLRVGGVIATSVMDQSIVSTRPGISGSQLTGSVLITAQLLDQSRKAVAAAEVLDSSAAVQDIAASIDGLTAYSSVSEASTVLPASSTDTLDNAVSLSTVASGSQLQEINTAASTGTVSGTTPANSAPVIGGTPAATVVAGSSYLFQPTASDADGNALSFAISGKPAWASFNTTSGRLSGTPAGADVGVYSNIVISVSDGTDTASLTAFSIDVQAAPVTNTAPVIGGVPAGSVMATNSYVFQPTATDADGDTLSFSIVNKPAWANFNTGNGVLSGTPSTGDVGSYGNIVISVSDGTDSDSLSAFTIQVDPVPVTNSAPVISGVPATVVSANSAYIFRPSATDADGDRLSFSIANQPAWAAFNTSSGELAGTPLNADAGSYNNITITVTDGTDSASLGPFSIAVNATNGSFTLTWVAPVARTDGTPLTLSDIDGYHIHYGSSPGNYPNIVDVTDGTATTATVSNVPAGDYYVVMSTYDTNGLESDLSGEVPKTAQ